MAPPSSSSSWTRTAYFAMGCAVTALLFMGSGLGSGVGVGGGGGGGGDDSSRRVVRPRPPPKPSATPTAAAPVYLSGAAVIARLYEPAGHDPRASALSLEPSRLAPLTHAAVELLWRNQHPDECGGATEYLVSLGHVKGNGIGSLMHVTGYHFALAVEEGRVFLFGDKSGEEWTDASTCGAARNWECFFRPPSPCGREHLRDGNHVQVELHHSTRKLGNQAIPTALRLLLAAERPDMDDVTAKYWWRAQSVAYLMRLNDATLAAVRALRTDALLITLAPAAGGPLSAARAAAIPLPPGVIHAHVRHGDKYTEMALQGTARYTNASIALQAAQPLTLRRMLYVSTEDPGVPAEAAELLTPAGWSVLHYGIRRSNTGPLNQLLDLGADSAGLTTRTHLQQMLLSMEADAWVGTRGSNWNRLLDELRCIWVDKCGYDYSEVGTPESWAGFNW